MFRLLPFIAVCLFLNPGFADATNKTILHVGLLLELTNYWYSPWASTFDEVFKNAFSKIHDTPELLDGFEFKIHLRNTKVRFCKTISIKTIYNSKYLLTHPNASLNCFRFDRIVKINMYVH